MLNDLKALFRLIIISLSISMLLEYFTFSWFRLYWPLHCMLNSLLIHDDLQVYDEKSMLTLTQERDEEKTLVIPEYYRSQFVC